MRDLLGCMLHRNDGEATVRAGSIQLLATLSWIAGQRNLVLEIDLVIVVLAMMDKRFAFAAAATVSKLYNMRDFFAGFFVLDPIFAEFSAGVNSIIGITANIVMRDNRFLRKVRFLFDAFVDRHFELLANFCKPCNFLDLPAATCIALVFDATGDGDCTGKECHGDKGRKCF